MGTRISARNARNKMSQYIGRILKESDDEEEYIKSEDNVKETRQSKLSKVGKLIKDIVYSCRNCYTTFPSKPALQKHKQSDACVPSAIQDETVTVKTETISMKLEDDKKIFVCKKCPLTFDSLKVLKVHRKEHAPQEFIENHTFSFDDVQELYICNTCSAEFKDKDEAERHTKAHGEIFQCSLCMDKFQTLFQLGSHLKLTHSEDDQFSCPLCPQLKFPKPSLFMKHIDTKHQKRYMYNCKDCGKGFHSKTLCKEHLNVHLGIKPFSCIVCGAGFTYSKSVVTHQLKAHRVEILGQSHTTECTYCRNRFVTVASLERHVQQVHSAPKAPQEKIHLCDICGMGFAKKNKMVVHQRVHTGVKPYHCRYCEKSFSKSGERNCHERIHTGERPYSCEYCGKAFRQSAPFKVHIRTHTGERPYVCNICTKGFTTNQGLKLHKKQCSSIDFKAY
ncbi:hypothetical protein HUJ05_004589 [Dendroctonus ponderosae]|nr:hypothetical protein HUJ05_004589 [Dendroctonus ponderosae]